MLPKFSDIKTQQIILQQPIAPPPNAVDAVTKAAIDGLTGTLIGVLFCLWWVFNKSGLDDRLLAVESAIKEIKNKEDEDAKTAREILKEITSVKANVEYIKDRQRKILRIYGAIYREKFNIPESANILDDGTENDKRD